MIHLRCLLIILCLQLSAPSIIAQYYKFIDENGNLIFTDDLSKVPFEQRKNIEIYEEFRLQPITESKQIVSIENKPVKDEDKKKLEALQTSLLKEKEELDNTLKALLERRKMLSEEQEKATTIDTIKIFNLKIEKFNKDTLSFDRRREEYEKRVSEFNQMVDAPPPPDEEIIE